MDELDNGSFKAFLAAAETLNFTLAAEKAAMTQSGISQHIAKLEEQIGTLLFKRVNKKVHLTEAGALLHKFIEGQREETSKLFERVHGEVNKITGLVRYAMPHSCLFTPHFPMLLQKRKDFSGVSLNVELCPNEEVFEKLISQQIDFGFATKKINNGAIKYELFAAEEYVLVGSDREELKALNKKNLLEHSFVSYPGMNILFDLWIENHFSTKKISYESLNISGTINSLNGAITMVEHGVGLTVLPKHCAAHQLKERTIFEFPSPKSSAFFNEIYIVTLNGVQHPKRVQTVMNAFWEMK